MTPLSVIVLSYNEEAVIAECLQSAAFADEILLVDSFSRDKTVEVARPYATRVLQHEFWSHGAQINWAIPQARNDWILILDADERVTPELGREITTLLAAPQHPGYSIPRRNFFLGREIKHGLWGGDTVLRLFHRGRGRYQEKHVHSQLSLEGAPGHCGEALLHYSYRSMADYTRKIGRFAQGGALNALREGRRSSPFRMLSHSLGRFIKSYVIKAGFLDGVEGLIIAFMEADHAFLKYATLWELQRKPPSPSPPVPTAEAHRSPNLQ